MMSAFQLLDRLEEQGLLEESVVKSLRRQMESSDKRLSAKSLASLLVRKGQLTASQARRVFESLPPPPPPEELGLASDETDIVEPLASDDIVEPMRGPTNDDLVPLAETELVPIAGLDDDGSGPPNVAPTVDVAADEFEGDPIGEDDIDDDLPSDESGRVVRRKRSGLGGLLASFGRPGRKKVSANQWDSPLLLVGGGGLLVLTLIGVALYFFLSRGTGDDAFNAANESYRQEAYGQAASQFRGFLVDYPKHPKTSMAKVKIGMSAIWSLVERKQWEDALQTVRDELPKIVGEESFDEGARPELASLLPEIMDGFAERALAAKEVPEAETLLSLAKQTHDEVNNSAYLPTSVRTGQQPRIEQIQDKLASVERRINRDRELVAAVDDIDQLASGGKIAEAYTRRETLLKTYPTIELDDRLEASTRGVAKAEQEAVKLVTATPEPLKSAQADPSLFHVVLSQRRGETAVGVGNRVLIVSTHGAVFGIHAADGSLQWRTPIGFQSNIPPLSLKSVNSEDVVVVRHDTNEVVRLDANTGNVVWRLPCPGPPTSPALSGGSLFFSCNDRRSELGNGIVFEVDPTAGTVSKAVALPVPISVSPMIDRQRNRIIQPADRSTIYLLDLATFACTGVTYAGHLSNTVAVPAVLLGEAILVAENPGVDFTLLHVFGYDTEQPGQLKTLMDPLRLNGQTVVPLGISDRRAVIVTDRGKVSVLELDLNRPDAPLRVTAETASSVQPGTASYALLQGGQLWVGDSQLNGYEVQTSRGQLVRKWINSKGDRFLAPLQRFGDVLFHVRQPAGRLGAAVSAVSVTGGQRRAGETIWEAVIAAPPAGEPFVDRAAQEIKLVTGNGALYAVGKETIRAGVDLKPKQIAGAGLFPLLTSSIQTTAHRVFLPEPTASNTIVTYQADRRSPLKPVELSLAAGHTFASTPAAFADGLLVAETSGAINVYDPLSGQPSMDPFQPSTDPLLATEWLRPAIFDNGTHAVLADKRGNLYHVAVEQSPKRRLVSVGQQASDAGFVSDPLVVGESVYGFVRGAQADLLRRFSLAELKMQEQSELPGRIAWGPYAVGEIGVFATEPHALIGVDKNGLRFTVAELDAALVGPPALYEGGFVVTTVDGSLVHMDLASGNVKASVKLDETLGSGPVQFAGNRFIVTGGDGTLHVVPLK